MLSAKIKIGSGKVVSLEDSSDPAHNTGYLPSVYCIFSILLGSTLLQGPAHQGLEVRRNNPSE